MNRVKKKFNPFDSEGFGLASFTIGAEAGNVINVAVRLKTSDNKNVAGRKKVTVYFADANTGAAVTGTGPNGTVAIGTNGAILNTVQSKKQYDIITDQNGQFDLNIGESGAVTWYLVVCLPDGNIVVSNAVTFA